MQRQTVQDVMTTDVVTVGPDTPFTMVARILTERRLNALPVVDEFGELTGIVSMSDLLHKEGHKDDPEGLFAFSHRARVSRTKAAGNTVAEVMTTSPVVVTPTNTLVMAAKTMARREVRQLPVVDESGRLVGIVSRTDLVRAFLRPDERIRDDVETELRGSRTTWVDLDGIDVEVHDGVVTLRGDVERRSAVDVAVRTAYRVDGVVDVRNKIRYSFDDTSPVYPTF